MAHIPHSSRKSAHAQEACLRGSGASVGLVKRTRMSRAPVEATMISLEHKSRMAWVYYWYKMGADYNSKYLSSSWKMFLDGLGGGQKGTSLIRLLSPETRTGRPEDVHAAMEDFTHYLIPALDGVLP